MQLSRRSLFFGGGSLLLAPAIVRASSLMPISSSYVGYRSNLLTIDMITRETVRMFVDTNSFIRNIDRQYDELFDIPPSAIGTKLRIRLPGDYKL